MTALAIFAGVMLVLVGVAVTWQGNPWGLLVGAIGVAVAALGAVVGRHLERKRRLTEPRKRIGLLTEFGLILIVGGAVAGFMVPPLLGACALGLLLAIVGAVLDRLERIRAELAYQRALAEERQRGSS